MTNIKGDDEGFLVAALYKFIPLTDIAALKPRIEAVCIENAIRGTVLLANEGINGTVAGENGAISALISFLEGMEEIGTLEVKYSLAAEQPFLRMKVRLKKEIVTLGVEGIDPNRQAGTYVDPLEWNKLISDPATRVIDTRNAYEVAIGTFDGAENPETSSFRDLPNWVDNNLDDDFDQPIAMFCTGGIRCEKSTALLKSKGYRNVFHLKGGILKYLEEIDEDESLWKGQCFVFDNRVSVGHGLEQGEYDLCHACRMPISEEEKQSDDYQPGISCPHCAGSRSEQDLARFAERQKQIELARREGANHLAVDLEQARQKKHEEREEHRLRSGPREAAQKI